MRSTTERIKLAEKQADEIKKQRNEKRHRLAVISCYSFGIALIVVISALVCNLNFAGFEQTPMHDTASIFANKGFLGYVVVGILAFLLGISVTLMCDILHKRNKERNEENDRKSFTAFLRFYLRMLLLHFGNTKQKLQSPFGIAFLSEFRNGTCLLGTVPYIVRHFSACVLRFGTELDGIVYFSCFTSLCRCTERKT